ncbi:MAG TPA: PKD domain-containing protein [Solirubrobacteraceae bacterium]|nr:PKD domain-containing protein [Solirubrobacteraceae bacterium]
MATLVACEPARADPYGELSRFSVAQSGLVLGEATSAFGVDPTDNDIYVGEEVPSSTPPESSGRYRILRFSPTGALLAESPALNPKSKTALGIEGIAVDPAQHRVYVLGLLERSEGEKIPDGGEAAAGTLFALNSATLKSEVPGVGKREEEGVLAGPEGLKADGKVAGEALLNPRGIAVDPTTHEVVMLGEVDTGTLTQTQRHIALERVSSVGALLASRYVDPAIELEPEVHSPVVTAVGDVLAARTTEENEEQIIQFPRGEGPPSVAFEFPAKLSGPASETVSHQELLEAGEYPAKGAGLALASEGAAGGVLYSDAEVNEQAFGPSGLELKNGFAGALAVNVQDAGGTVTTGERGWTGGANSLANPQAKCALAEHEGDYPLLGAGGEGRLFALDLPSAQVVEFGPGGEGCPHASAPAVPAIEVSDEGGLPLQAAAAGAEATFSTQVVQGDVLSSKWEFGDGTSPQTSTAGEYQLAEAHHTFSTPGTYTITEKISTDDLATPELTVQRTLVVKKAQTITFTSTAPETAVVEGPSYAVSATATSGLAVEFSSATPEHCSVSGSTVKPTGAGTCTIDANQAGDGEWAPAKQVVQSFAVTQLAQTLTFTSTAPAKAAVGGPGYTVTAQGGASGEPVELAIDGASASVCSLSGTTSGSNVSFIGSGTCTIDANQKGSANYKAAPQAQQSIAVKRAQAISFTNGKPENAAVGATYSPDPVATSALAVELSSATAATCTVSGATVTFVGAGVCEILANQAGNGEYEPAPQVGQSFSVAVRALTPGPGPAHAAPSTGLVGVLSYRAGLQSTTLSVSGAGVVVVKVRCLGTSSCTGKLTLRTLAAVRIAMGKRKAVVVLAVGSFALSGGQTKALALHLTATGRKLVALLRVLRARAVILANDATGVSHSTPLIVRLRAAKKRH